MVIGNIIWPLSVCLCLYLKNAAFLLPLAVIIKLTRRPEGGTKREWWEREGLEKERLEEELGDFFSWSEYFTMLSAAALLNIRDANFSQLGFSRGFSLWWTITSLCLRVHGIVQYTCTRKTLQPHRVCDTNTGTVASATILIVILLNKYLEYQSFLIYSWERFLCSWRV